MATVTWTSGGSRALMAIFSTDPMLSDTLSCDYVGYQRTLEQVAHVGNATFLIRVCVRRHLRPILDLSPHDLRALKVYCLSLTSFEVVGHDRD